MSERITTAFARAADEGRAALVVYLTAFDGGRAHSLACLRAAVDAGADVVELGVPFSDPAADGPTIAAAMVRALAAGATCDSVIELAAELAAHHDVPTVLFGYANPLLRAAGDDPDALALRLRAAGIDGVLVVDLPPEHAAAVREPLVAHGVDWIGLVAPTTTAARRVAICSAASGFVYAITRRGVTGGALVDHERAEVVHNVAAIEAACRLPVAVGFGVRTPDDVARLAPHASGVVVGTALVVAAQQGPEALAREVAALRRATVRRA
jgi:tryptophan synthase alpha chain